MSIEGRGRDQQPTSARDVERVVLSRIASGQYPVGMRLPTCEVLGREVGANKNTVSKAYRALARRGFVTSSAGRGTFAVRRPRETDQGDAAREVRGAFLAAVEQADLYGMSDQAVSALALEIISRYFDRVAVRVGYVDCCDTDARYLARSIEETIATPVEPLVLDPVSGDLPDGRDRFDVLAVNLSHLGAVERWSRQDEGARPEIVPVLTVPDSTSLMQVARLRPGSRLLVVADATQTLHVLRGLARSLNDALDITSLPSGDVRLREVVPETDAILVTASAAPRVAVLRPRAPLIKVVFKLDDESIRFVAERVSHRMHPKA